jgi:hypothetical protein
MHSYHTNEYRGILPLGGGRVEPPKCEPDHVYVMPNFVEDYNGVSKSFRTGRLERELQMVRFSAPGAVGRFFMSQSSEFCSHNSLCYF